MSETKLRGSEWNDVVEVLHALSNTVTVRSHYSEGHPAIGAADDSAGHGFQRVLERIPDLVVALIDGEFVVCERPLPELRSRFKVLADAMVRHQIECFVFQKGMRRDECAVLAAALAKPQDMPGRVREQAQAGLQHVLLRFAGLVQDEAGHGTDIAAPYFASATLAVLVGAARAIGAGTTLDRTSITELAGHILAVVAARTFALQQRSWSRNIEDEAAHAANVAMMTAAMVVDAGYPQRTCIDAVAAALVHDIGHLFLPEAIRGVPEPLLGERDVPVFRNHAFAGASMLLGAGCPPIWVAAAFEHHRGVDGGGYPEVTAKDPPHEIVRTIALANFMDRKRTLLADHPVRVREPEDALLDAMGLEERYFGASMVRRFVRALGVYPPGTTVALSDGSSAVVTRANAVDAWRPQVRLLHGANVGKRAELRDPKPRDERFALSIVRATMPPMLRYDDVLAEAREREAVVEERAAPVAIAIAPEEPIEAGPRESAADKARASLGGMETLLDSLLTIPQVALSAPSMPAVRPPASGAPPPPRPSIEIPATPMRVLPGTSQWPGEERRTSSTRTPRVVIPREDPDEGVESPRRRPSIEIIAPPPPSSGRRQATPPPKAPSAPPVRAVSIVDKRAVLVLARRDLAQAGLDHRGAFLLGFIDGATSVGDVVDASGIGEDEALAIIRDLLERGAVTLE